MSSTSPDIPASPYFGGCHCGALRWRLHTGKALGDFSPRACDCDFCTRHGAAWVSDAGGALRFEDLGGRLQRYRQGSGQAQFLLCTNCGVLAGVVAVAPDGRLLGAINRNSFDERDRLGNDIVVSPRRLAPDAKLERWSQLWTPAELP